MAFAEDRAAREEGGEGREERGRRGVKEGGWRR